MIGADRVWPTGAVKENAMSDEETTIDELLRDMLWSRARARRILRRSSTTTTADALTRHAKASAVCCQWSGTRCVCARR